jgi:hypothetical protein
VAMDWVLEGVEAAAVESRGVPQVVLRAVALAACEEKAMVVVVRGLGAMEKEVAVMALAAKAMVEEETAMVVVVKEAVELVKVVGVMDGEEKAVVVRETVVRVMVVVVRAQAVERDMGAMEKEVVVMALAAKAMVVEETAMVVAVKERVVLVVMEMGEKGTDTMVSVTTVTGKVQTASGAMARVGATMEQAVIVMVAEGKASASKVATAAVPLKEVMVAMVAMTSPAVGTPAAAPLAVVAGTVERLVAVAEGNTQKDDRR